MRWTGFLLSLALSLLGFDSASAETVRTVIPRSTLNYLSVPVAEVKGFFRDEVLENETVVIPGSTAIAALVSGNVDYGGTGMRAPCAARPSKRPCSRPKKSPGICWRRPTSGNSPASKASALPWAPSATLRTR